MSPPYFISSAVLRRCGCRSLFGSPSRHCRRPVNRLANAKVSSAAAQVPFHRVINLGIGRLRNLRQQRRRRHDLSCLAVAALRHVDLLPSHLRRVRPVGESPSMVVIFLPATLETSVTHDRVAWPSMCTVQTPHSAIPHPYFVPRRFRTSRITHNRGMSAGTSTRVECPLITNSKGMVSTPLKQFDPGKNYLLLIIKKAPPQGKRKPRRFAFWQGALTPAYTLRKCPPFLPPIVYSFLPELE